MRFLLYPVLLLVELVRQPSSRHPILLVTLEMDFNDLVRNRHDPRKNDTSDSSQRVPSLRCVVLVCCLPAILLPAATVLLLPFAWDRIGVCLAYDPLFQIAWLAFACVVGTFMLRPFSENANKQGRVVVGIAGIIVIHIACFAITFVISCCLAIIQM